MLIVRIAGYVILAVAAVGAWVYFEPERPSGDVNLPAASVYDRMIGAAMSDYEANNALADSAPQQTVVNGWVARDLLWVIAQENADLLRAQGAIYGPEGIVRAEPFDERVPALLLIGVLALAWGGLTAPTMARRQPSLNYGPPPTEWPRG